MTYVVLDTAVSGAIIPAAYGNKIRDNFAAGPNGIVTTAGDLVYATGAGALARLPAPATTYARLLRINQSGLPEWTSTAVALDASHVTGAYLDTPLSRASGSGDIHQMYLNPSISVGASATVGRASSLSLENLVASIAGGGVLSNLATLWLGTPSGAGSNRVIDSAAGAFLTTGGAWTNNPSWADLKEEIEPVPPHEVRALLDWLRDEYRPVRYRYKDQHEIVVVGEGASRREVEVLTRYERSESDFRHFGFLLDDMPEHIREIVCSDGSGGISTKDSEGFLFALVQGLAIEVDELRRSAGVRR